MTTLTDKLPTTPGAPIEHGSAGFSATVASLAGALAAAQAEMKNPPKESVNPHFRSKYADLATVRDAVIPVLNRHGLAVLQLPCEVADGPALSTVLIHSSGEWARTTILLRPGKTDPQGVGSALTYARRYALQSIAGVAADDDDDANGASRPAAQERRPTQPAPERRPEPAQRADPPPAAKPAAEPEIITAGDPVTDSAAAGLLATAKGLPWAAVYTNLNGKFKADYSLTRTKWLDIPRDQRAAVVAGLNKLPDAAPTETSDSVWGVVEDVAKAAGQSTNAVMLALTGDTKIEATYLDDMTPDQLAAAGKWARARLAELKKGGGK